MDDSKYELQDFRGTLVNFKDGFHRKISTWTFFAAVSFHPRHVTFSTSVHPFSLNWSFNVIRIPVQLPVKLNTLLWNYSKKEETFHHVNTKSRQIQNFIAPCFFQCAIFFYFLFLKDTRWPRDSYTIFVSTHRIRRICYEEKYLDTLFHFIDFRLRVTGLFPLVQPEIQLEITKRI